MLRTFRNWSGRCQATVKAAMAPLLVPPMPAARRVLRDVVVLGERRQQLVDDDPRVPIVELVVLGRPVRRLVAPLRRVGLGLFRRSAGIDEHGDHHRQLATVNQVVEHVRRPGRAGHVDERLAVLEDHQVRFDGRIVLSGHVDPIGVLRAGIGLAVREDERAAQHALGHALSLERVRTERVVRVHVASRRRLRWRGLWRRALHARARARSR